MTYVLTYGNSSQDLGFSVNWELWHKNNEPANFDPVWEIHLNGGDDIFLFDDYQNGQVSYNIYGGSGNDILYGGSSGDIVDGGTGNDTIYDSAGNDLYILDSLDDIILSMYWTLPNQSTGNDTVQASVDYVMPDMIENLVLTGTAEINGFGNSLRNSLTGNSAANILDGLQGADTMTGGKGDDVYVVDSAYDIIIETSNQGIDLIETGVSFTLPAFVEQGFLNSAGRSQSLTGNSLGNLLVGNSGRNTLTGLDGSDELRGEGGNDSLYGGDRLDTLDGGSGVDRMDGGLGNDIYYVENGLDLVIESTAGSTGGYDTVFTSVSIVMPESVEKLVFNGLADGVQLTGNDLANYLIGNYTDDIIDVGAGSDTASGGSGDDTVYGGSGNDTIGGDFGADTLNGGTGRDVLTGGQGTDTFVFVGTTDSNSANTDVIQDFEDDLDTIDLRQIDAAPASGNQAFTFIDDAAFSAAGQVRVVYVSGSDVTRIEVSIDNDNAAEMTILLNGEHLLTAANFLL